MVAASELADGWLCSVGAAVGGRLLLATGGSAKERREKKRKGERKERRRERRHWSCCWSGVCHCCSFSPTAGVVVVFVVMQVVRLATVRNCWRSCSRREKERKGKRMQQGEERRNRGFAGEGDDVSLSRRRRWRREMEEAADFGRGERE
ncbi:hypothetical protein KY284_032554 [Solanum tuberosum]|nr:hypothetical protein KY284_032554 [Solanum tuberosum]